MVSTLAGTKGKKGFADGAITQFNGPCGICFHERDQMLIVCDHGNGKLRRVTLDGTDQHHYYFLMHAFMYLTF